MTTTYSVECLRSGQPRPYADHIYEYVITCTLDGKPWLMGGVVEAQAREWQINWAKRVARALAVDWKEKGAGDWASTFLQSLTLDAVKGTIRVVCTSAYTD